MLPQNRHFELLGLHSPISWYECVAPSVRLGRRTGERLGSADTQLTESPSHFH